MILIVQNSEEYNNDLRSMILAFFPQEKIKGIRPVTAAQISREMHEEISFMVTAIFSEEETWLKLEKDGAVKESAVISGNYKNKKSFRNRFKLAVYKMLCDYTGRKLPWGCLTGVRPTKIAMAGFVAGKSKDDIIDDYQRIYEVSFPKAKLAAEVAEYERELISEIDSEKDYCLYVGIPFCPSRCLYCSFTSYPIELYKDSVEKYLDALIKELQYISYTCRNKRLIAIYIGGGTPTSLESNELDRLLSEIEKYFDLSQLKEYTVEAGRPDSITEEKLKVMKEKGVTRISINPQTMNDETLKLIGRRHTAEQTMDAFYTARRLGFDNINMDLIAGLPGEDIYHMKHTTGLIRELKPDSITVHSLAVKRAANLKQEMDTYYEMLGNDTDKMLGQVNLTARGMGLKPYYLYRQKNISGNLENIGYAVKGKECSYNILIMEEKTDIFAAGAGASTKILRLSEGKVARVDRAENVKNVDEYIMRIDEMIERKEKLLQGKEA